MGCCSYQNIATYLIRILQKNTIDTSRWGTKLSPSRYEDMQLINEDTYLINEDTYLINEDMEVQCTK